MVAPEVLNPPNEAEHPVLMSLYTALLSPPCLLGIDRRPGSASCAEIAHRHGAPHPYAPLVARRLWEQVKPWSPRLAAATCMDAGWQCALMAPTEILAEQHFRKLLGWLEPLGITTAWLTGTQKAKERREMLALIESGQAKLVVGTHAIIQDKVKFKNLALAIIDEQHRFGVAQRLALRNKLHHEDMEPHHPHDDRDSHSAHVGDELLRRPRRIHS